LISKVLLAFLFLFLFSFFFLFFANPLQSSSQSQPATQPATLPSLPALPFIPIASFIFLSFVPFLSSYPSILVFSHVLQPSSCCFIIILSSFFHSSLHSVIHFFPPAHSSVFFFWLVVDLREWEIQLVSAHIFARILSPVNLSFNTQKQEFEGFFAVLFLPPCTPVALPSKHSMHHARTQAMTDNLHISLQNI